MLYDVLAPTSLNMHDLCSYSKVLTFWTHTVLMYTRSLNNKEYHSIPSMKHLRQNVTFYNKNFNRIMNKNSSEYGLSSSVIMYTLKPTLFGTFVIVG